MKILITGSHGQLGKELYDILSAMESEIGPVPVEYRDADIFCVDIDTVDLSSPTEVDELAENHEDHPFDLVIHCAAMTNVDGCEGDPEAALKGNAIAAGNIARFAKKQDAKLVHVSTDYVFNGNATAPYTEWDLPAPVSVYGKSKWLGEQYAAAAHNKLFIVRTSWLYGKHGGNFVKTIQRIAAENERITVIYDQVGNPTSANDLAYHILKIGASDYYGIYHVTGGGVCSWFEFAQEIVRLSGLKCEVAPVTNEEYPRPAPRPAYSAMDHIMLRTTVGDEMRPWEEALASLISKLS